MPIRFVPGCRAPIGILSGGGPVLTVHNEQSFPVTAILREALRGRPGAIVEIETFAVGGRAPTDLARWARAGTDIRLAVPAKVAGGSVGRELRRAGVAVEKKRTHRKRIVVRHPSGDVRIYGSQNLEDLGWASVEYALAVPTKAEATGIRVTETSDRGCLADAVLAAGWDAVDVVTWTYGAAEVRRLVDAGVKVRLVCWRGEARLRRRNNVRATLPDGIRAVPGPVHGKFAVTPDGSGLILTTANLTRNLWDETLIRVRDERIGRWFADLFLRLHGAVTPLRLGSEVDRLLRSATAG